MEEIILNLINSSKYELLGEGFISKSYKLEINSEKYILLQGQISDSFGCYLKSYNNLKFLLNENSPLIKSIQFPSNKITLIKPNQNCPFFKFGGLLYIEIKGLVFYEKYFDKINIEKVATTISKFLKELYCIPINKDDIKKVRDKMKKSFNSDMSTIKKYFGNENIDKLNAFEIEYLEYINNFDDFHYTHGDFWQENMIISEDYQDLVGVVDFDNFGIGDIAKDYASLLNFGFDFINILIDKTKDIIQDKENFIKRVKIYEKFIELEDVAYILRYENLKGRLNSKLENLKKLNLI
jgi:hypothetical protein